MTLLVRLQDLDDSGYRPCPSPVHQLTFIEAALSQSCILLFVGCSLGLLAGPAHPQ